MSLKNFDILGELGAGTFASVYKVRRHEDQQIYALKKVRLLSLAEKEKDNALNEVRILASIKSPHIITYKQSFLDRQTAILYLVTEYADDGDLQKRVMSMKEKKMLIGQDEVWSAFIQIAKGLRYLHALNIAHRDIKLANVYLFKNGKVKIGDMNVSKVIKNEMCMTQTGTPYYASPEVWRDVPYNTKSDIWSLGCMIYEMVTLSPPFVGENMEELYKKVLKGIYPKISHKYSKNLRNLIRMMLQVDPQSRPSIAVLLQYAESVMNKARKGLEYSQQRVTQSAQNLQEKLQKNYRLTQKQNEEDDNISLLGTIKVPKKMAFLPPKLPKPNYQLRKRDHELKRKSGDRLPSIDRSKQISILEHSQKLQKARSQKLLPLPAINPRNLI